MMPLKRSPRALHFPELPLDSAKKSRSGSADTLLILIPLNWAYFTTAIPSMPYTHVN